jgi:hypothetical protein
MDRGRWTTDTAMKKKSQFKKWAVLLPALLLSCFLVRNGGGPQAAAPEGKQKGMSFAAWWPGLYSTVDADQAQVELKDDGVNWISLIVTQYQDTIASTTIYSADGTPTDADLVHAINQAHSLGLKVMLKPHLDLANDPTHWRGEIGTGFSEADWIAWFSSYKAFINTYAQLAEANGADQFCVGTELVATEFRSADWQAVIAGVRALTTLPLTYAANHGSEGAISWWDRLDYLGMDAYYPLTGKNNPTLAELKAAWTPIAASLKTLSDTWGKPVIFTEIGYRSQDGANQHPWDYQVSGTLDLQEQADLYRAVLESVFDQAWFGGIYWWSWDPDPLQGGPCDMGYSPHDKPAEAVLRQWYGASPKPAEEVPGLDPTHSMPVYTDALGAGWAYWSWGGTFSPNSTEQVHSGTHAIKAETPSYGAVALHHEAFDSSPYYWLELYVYKTSDASTLAVWASDGNDVDLPSHHVEDCRYTGGHPITPGTWTHVLIPLKDLKAGKRLLDRLSIGNGSDTPFTYYVDDVSLVGGTWKRCLPLALKP